VDERGSKGSQIGRILVVDDDPKILQIFSRALESVGHTVTSAPSGEAAVEQIKMRRFDVVLSDIAMPGMGGLELLRQVRDHDADIPLILITGSPLVESAMKAVEYGALRYLLKPVRLEELRTIVSEAVKLHELARLKREMFDTLGLGMPLSDRAGMEATFRAILDSLTVVFQPIVNWSERSVYAYEALVRSRSGPPSHILEVAERLAQLPVLGRTIRASVAKSLADAPPATSVFVNLHPLDLLDDELFQGTTPLARYSKRVVLEITERASLETIPDASQRMQELRMLGYRIALDDLGAGYAGLTSFAQLEPDVVKIDVALVRGIDADPLKQRMVGTLLKLFKDLGKQVVAEGVETAEERDALTTIGCELFQGYLFAKPGPNFPSVIW
jgi:EAL domain-containing protein (putative c-di-GMP-specific phosphodiesterase class I)